MSKQIISDEQIAIVLEWAYEKSLHGLPGTSTAFEVANQLLDKHESTNNAINYLIRSQITKNALNGFLFGIGGLATLPVVIPANISLATYLQIRMIAAVAHLQGYDLRKEETKTLVFVCLTGRSAADVLKKARTKIGIGIAKQSLKSMNRILIKAINRAVGVRLVTKLGGKGIFNISRAAPVLGGIVGATIDGVSTKTIGQAAKQVFK